MDQPLSICVVGGGAAGFFTAITAKQNNPDISVHIIEKNAALLTKVRVSGGGRCNVTHACFDPKELIKNYPRGNKELLGPFHQFQPSDTINWFAKNNIALKTEDDGRVFPTTDSSQTIIDCFLSLAAKLGIKIWTEKKTDTIKKNGDIFTLMFKDSSILKCRKLVLTTGSSPKGFEWAKLLGHSINKPIPSLFTFNIPKFSLSDLSGVSCKHASIKIKGAPFEESGPLLITHFGFSGPAALRLSAFAAKFLNRKNYCVDISINWAGKLTQNHIKEQLIEIKKTKASHMIFSENIFQLPKKLWKELITRVFGFENKRLNDITLKEIDLFSQLLTKDLYSVKGKTLNKDEFVTCGGVKLSEVNFKTMESKICKNLFFAGEILDVDGVTGGFNFQNAWTSGYLAGLNAAN